MLDYGLMTPSERLVEEVIRLKAGERVLVAHDRASASIAQAIELCCSEKGAAVEIVDLEAAQLRPWTQIPARVLQQASRAHVTVLAVTDDERESTPRSEFLMHAIKGGARHVHLLSPSREAFCACLMASPVKVFELMNTLLPILRSATKLSVRSPGGTSLAIELSSRFRWGMHGKPLEPGEWLNIPFGALFTFPASATGTFVVDASLSGNMGLRAGLLQRSPITLTVENSQVRQVRCADRTLSSHVEGFINGGQDNDKVGIINLGANTSLRNPIGNILHDEHIPGIHLSLGHTFPKFTGAFRSGVGQLAMAGADADVDLDGTPLIRRGRYVRHV